MMLFLLLLVPVVIVLIVAYRRQAERLRTAELTLDQKQGMINELKAERREHLATIQHQERRIRLADDQVRSMMSERSIKQIVDGPAQVIPFVVGGAPSYDNFGFPTDLL